MFYSKPVFIICCRLAFVLLDLLGTHAKQRGQLTAVHALIFAWKMKIKVFVSSAKPTTRLITIASAMKDF